jgi:hypothetical protein
LEYYQRSNLVLDGLQPSPEVRDKVLKKRPISHLKYIGLRPGAILRLLNCRLQRQRCSRLERFQSRIKYFCFSKPARLPVAL